ncbi:MAG: toprim domain-containing protein, partial [Clostridia bacterium]|nr:toprim domain-containing protein [Clostridia bacterium]
HPKAPPKVLPTPRLIIPTSKTSYLARDTRNVAVIPENQSKYVKSKVGNVHIFNEKALNNTPVLYIVEGEIDALSIIDVGGNAVGLGSVSNINSLFKVLDHSDNVQKQKFVISLDNDKAGEKAKNALIDGFCKRGIAFCVYNPSGEHKDSNEALMSNRSEFEKAVLYGIENVDKLIKEYGEKENMEYQQKYCAEVLLGGFIDRIAANVNIEAIPTGFKALDDVLDGGLYEGLYCLGAISSLGKTTFALQIADQIAEHGHQVLIFSLEMSQNELIAKSISRNTMKRVIAARGDVKNAKTARGIMSGKKYPLYNQTERELIKNAVGDYQSISKNIYIREGMGNVGVDTIVEQVKEHIRKGNKPPVVIVDYLQILMPHSEKATDKANIDYTVLSLKRLSRDYKIPVIAISSFNRVSYGNEVSMQAFKESGSIEYSCDVLMGLQLQGVGSSDFDVNIAKRQEPRKIEAVILKNRNGKTGDMIGYEYYAMFNYFSETGLTEIPEKRPKYKRSEML